MRWDTYTLVVVLNQGIDTTAEATLATGELYVDDGESFDYEAGAYIHRRFTVQAAQGALELSSTDLIEKAGKKTKEYLKTMAGVTVERVIIVGAHTAWKDLKGVDVIVSGTKARTAGFEYHESTGGKAAWAVIKNPKASIGEAWKVSFS